jgi:hypothetical protein
MYLLVMMDNIRWVFLIFGLLSIAIFLINHYICEHRSCQLYEKEEKVATMRYHRKIGNCTLCVFSCATIILGIVPSTKQAVTIWLVPKMVNAVQANEQMQELPNNILNLANEWIEAMRPEKQDKEQK